MQSGRDGDTMILTFIHRALIQEPMLPKARLAPNKDNKLLTPGRYPGARGERGNLNRPCGSIDGSGSIGQY